MYRKSVDNPCKNDRRNQFFKDFSRQAYQSGICGIHFVYCYDAKGTCEMYKIYDPVNLSVLCVITDYIMNFSVV